MGKIRRRQRTYKNRSRSAKHRKIINMKGCSNRNCGQTGGCCGVMSGGRKTRRQVGGQWSAWNPTSGGEVYKLNSYHVQPDRMMEATRTVLGSDAFAGGGRSKRKGRKSRRTIRNKKLQKGGVCGVLSQQKGGSVIQEFWNGAGLINDMASNAYRAYNGLEPLPSSSVYKGQFVK